MGGTSLWLKPQMAWPSAQHGTAGLKGYRPCRRPLSVHERDLHREGETATTNNAEMLPTKRIRSGMSFQNLWRMAMKCQISKTSVPSLWRTACETAEQQQDSCLNQAKQRPRTMPKCCLRNALSVEWASKTFGGPLWNVKHQKLASKAFDQPLPKQPNSSRIRVQTMRNSDHAQCRNVAYETH